MTQLSDDQRKALLRLSRSAIQAEMEPGLPVARPQAPGPDLLQKRGCFVTLHLNEALRGCIGVIEPSRALWVEVEEHACHAAFRDPRFSPLTLAELERVNIEISVLTVPEPLDYTNCDQLLERLTPGKHGVMLSSGVCRATFLPQVWDQLPDKRIFLTHLCIKAGLSGDCWKAPDIRIRLYEAEYFSE